MDITKDIPNVPEGEPKALHEPVFIFGQSDELTCAEFYDVIWENACHDRVSFHIDSDTVDSFIDPIVKYLTALMFVRWAVSADVDIEEGLIEEIKAVFAESDGLIYQPLDTSIPRIAEHNEDDFVFAPNDKLSDWLAEEMARAANNLSGWGHSGYNPPDDEFIYTVGERPGHNKPCFRNEAFKHAEISMHGSLSIIYGSLHGVGIEMVAVKRDGEFSNEPPHSAYTMDEDGIDIEADGIEEVYHLVQDGTLTSNNARVIIVEEDENLIRQGVAAVAFMDAFGVIDDEIEHYVLISKSRGKLMRKRTKDVLDVLGIPVLTDVSGQDVPFEGELDKIIRKTDRSLNNNVLMFSSEWEYLGDISEELAKEIDAIMSFEEISSITSDLVSTPDESGQESFLASCYDEVHDMVSENVVELGWAYLMEDGVEKEELENMIRSVKGFGDHEYRDLDHRTTILMKFYKQSVLDEMSHRISTPVYDRLCFMHELYKMEKVLAPPEFDWARTIYDQSRSDENRDGKAEFSRLWQEFEKRRDESGVLACLDAYDNGTPAEDILA